MDEFKDSKTALVADVDCTTEGKSLCEKHEIRGYPSLKWGDPNGLQDYNGGRDFNALKTFADENLGPSCGPDNLELCDEETKQMIVKFQDMQPDDLEKAIGEGDAVVKKITDDNQKKVDKLQIKISNLNAEIEALNKKKDEKVKQDGKKLGLRFMNSVAAANKKKTEGSATKKKRKSKKKEL